VVSDLNCRRGQIQSLDPRQNGRVVRAWVPQVELHYYATDLHGMTQGRGTYATAFSHYRDLGGDDDDGGPAGVFSPLKPLPPTLSAGAAAEPPSDEQA